MRVIFVPHSPSKRIRSIPFVPLALIFAFLIVSVVILSGYTLKLRKDLEEEERYHSIVAQKLQLLRAELDSLIKQREEITEFLWHALGGDFYVAHYVDIFSGPARDNLCARWQSMGGVSGLPSIEGERTVALECPGAPATWERTFPCISQSAYLEGQGRLACMGLKDRRASIIFGQHTDEKILTNGFTAQGRK